MSMIPCLFSLVAIGDAQISSLLAASSSSYLLGAGGVYVVTQGSGSVTLCFLRSY